MNVRSELPGNEVWLIYRRHPEAGELKTYISNTPANVSLETLVKVSSMRWSIETRFNKGNNSWEWGIMKYVHGKDGIII